MMKITGKMFKYAQITSFKENLADINDILISKRKIIADSYVDTQGKISTNIGYYTLCVQVPENGVISSVTSDGSHIAYAFYTSEPSLNSVSYNGSRTTTASTSLTNISIPDNCTWFAVRGDNSTNFTVSPSSFALHDLTEKYSSITKYGMIIPNHENKINITDTAITIPTASRILYGENVYRNLSPLTIQRVATSESTYADEVVVFNASTQIISCEALASYSQTESKYVLFLLAKGLTNISLPISFYTIGGKKPLQSEKEIHENMWKAKANVCKRKRNQNAIAYCNLKFAFISDIHQDEYKMKLMMDIFKSWGNTYFDTMINAGDIARSLNADGYNWYFYYTANCNVLNAVGNHDAWELEVPGDWSTVRLVDKRTVYNTLIAPTISNNTGIVQPTGASTNGYNYYYKDFGYIRVIIIDCMYWDNTQKLWLQTVLSDAKTNNKQVLCVTHAIFAESELRYLDSKWNCDYPAYRDDTNTPIECAEVVDDFIEDDGVFIGWFCGHTHSDELFQLKNHNNQFVFATATARDDGYSNTPKGESDSFYNYILMNYVCIDAVDKVIKVQRIGADTDIYNVQRDSFTYDYDSKQLIN